MSPWCYLCCSYLPVVITLNDVLLLVGICCCLCCKLIFWWTKYRYRVNFVQPRRWLCLVIILTTKTATLNEVYGCRYFGSSFQRAEYLTNFSVLNPSFILLGLDINQLQRLKDVVMYMLISTRPTFKLESVRPRQVTYLPPPPEIKKPMAVDASSKRY